MNILVPVTASRTNQATVGYAVDRIRQSDDGGVIHLIYTQTPKESPDRELFAGSLLERSASIASHRADESITIVTGYLGKDRYLASPDDHVTELARYASQHDIDHLLLDPNYSVDATDNHLQPLRHALVRAGIDYEYADLPQVTHRPQRSEVIRAAAVFGIALAFYLAITVPWDVGGLLTALVASIITGLIFRNVAFESTPIISKTIGTIARGLLHAPYLLGKIAVANLQISYVVLHPRLPIDPHLDLIATGLPDGLTVTGLANSLTLTPGTLTVDAVRNELLVHSITPETRLEVLRGERTAAIQSVFMGKNAREAPVREAHGRIETLAGPVDATDLLQEEYR